MLEEEKQQIIVLSDHHSFTIKTTKSLRQYLLGTDCYNPAQLLRAGARALHPSGCNRDRGLMQPRHCCACGQDRATLSTLQGWRPLHVPGLSPLLEK